MKGVVGIRSCPSVSVVIVASVQLFIQPIAHASDGDDRSSTFVRPFTAAQQLAKQENRLLFVKPVYGGVDEHGAADYRGGRGDRRVMHYGPCRSFTNRSSLF